MSEQPHHLGGVIHTYQKYDPIAFPSPAQPPPDVASSALEYLLMFGGMRELTDEQLARAVRIDPRQIAGFGPSIEALIAMLQERKRKILATYETRRVQADAGREFRRLAERMQPPTKLAKPFAEAVREEQLRDLERVWYRLDDERSKFARQLVQLVDKLGTKYQIDDLASRYEFTGRTPLTIPQALEVREELRKIDELLKQLEEAAKNAQVGVIDMDWLSEFAEPGDIEQLNRLHEQIQEYLRDIAQQQGLEKSQRGYQLTPKAYRLVQGKLLERIFSELQPSRTGRHQGPIVGEGAVELQRTKPYEFGDSVANMDVPASLINALVRTGAAAGLFDRVRMKPEDIEIHRTRNTPKCATVVIMDMSGSMRYDGQYVNVKRMALALDGLIRKEYPGDYVQFVEMYTFAKPRAAGEIVSLLPKPVTIHDPWIALRADMSNPDISEHAIHPHFTNIQHALQTSRRFLAAKDTPNRQIVLITDGLPTAHFEGSMLYLLYPPDPRTEAATLREGQLCKREGITINIFLVPSWSQSEEDIRFAYRLAESTTGRVIFTAGRDLDRYVIWDYVARRREILA